MSFLLESLGRGLPAQLVDALADQLPAPTARLSDLAERTQTNPTRVDALLEHATACLRDMRLADAHQLFSAALEHDQTGLLPALGLACVCDEQGYTDQALQWLQRASALDRRAAGTQFALGVCYERAGRQQQALMHYREALAICPRRRNAHERLAALAISGGDWSQAQRICDALAELECDDMSVLLTSAALRLQAERPREAVDAFQRALLVEPESGDDGASDDGVLDTAGKLRHAIESAEQLVERYPGVSEFRVHLADLYVKAANDGGAVAQYSAAIGIRPNSLEASVKLGTQHLRRQRYGAAAEYFNRAAELNDRLLFAFVGLGVAQHAAQMPLDAAATLDLAASLAPNSTLLVTESTRLSLKLRRRNRRAAPALQEPDAEAPSDELLMRDAIDRSEKALQLHPTSAELHYRLAMLARQTGDFVGSLERLREATRLSPSYARARIKLGVALHETGRREEALVHLRQAILLDEQATASHYELALLFSQRNRFDLTIERFELANPRETALRANLTLALQTVGMIDAARASWDLLCDLTCGEVDPSDAQRISLPGD